jgi:hypothetical protein
VIGLTLEVLDQLDVFNDIEKLVEPLENALTWTGDGKLVVNSNAPILTGKRFVSTTLPH